MSSHTIFFRQRASEQNQSTNDINRLNTQFKLLMPLFAFFLTINIASMALAYKLSALGSYGFQSGGSFIFPFTYAILTIIVEVYGYRIGKQVIYYNLISLFLFAVVVSLIIGMPSPAFMDNQSSYLVVFGRVFRTMLVTLICAGTGDFINAVLLSKWKRLLLGRFFILRGMMAALIGEFVNLGLAILITFWGMINVKRIGAIFLFAYTYKLIFMLATILLVKYAVVLIKRIEKLDVLDKNVNYNPFRWR